MVNNIFSWLMVIFLDYNFGQNMVLILSVTFHCEFLYFPNVKHDRTLKYFKQEKVSRGLNY